MAWLQNLAGRAEDLLNKIDQNAATVLNEGNIKLLDKEKKSITENLGAEEKKGGGRFIQDFKENDFTIENEDTNPNNETEILTTNFEDTILSNTETQQEAVVNIDTEENLVKSFKVETPGSKSVSSHDSFILNEDPHYLDRINTLENENENLNKQLLNLQHLYAELRNENANLQLQIESSNHLVVNAQSEMEQYKARAQRILQEKENLILLKNQSKLTETTDNILTNYNEELKKEVEFQQNKNSELTEKVKKLTQDNMFLQQQIILIQNTSQQSSQTLQENLASEKKLRMMTEEECRIKNNELQLKNQELSQQYQIIQMKNEEIRNLKEEFKKKVDVQVNNNLETRIKSLTDTLMVKQNALERITSERNALKLQLEKLENEYQNNLAQLERAQVRVINVNDTDDVKSQVPRFMRVSPFDAGVTRRVKHAYSTVDAISIRTGIFLRRYPLARVCVFCYMVLLHFWALIVLFLYAPSNR